MSVEHNKMKLHELLAKYPRDLRMLRSEADVDSLNALDGELHGPFDNGDTGFISTVESALVAGKQAAVFPAGKYHLSVLISKPGKKLFRW